MNSWNYNIDEAPKGEIEIKHGVSPKGKATETEIFKPEPCIISTKCKRVFFSWRLSNGRWHGLRTDESPVAWQPRPEPAQ